MALKMRLFAGLALMAALAALAGCGPGTTDDGASPRELAGLLGKAFAARGAAAAPAGMPVIPRQTLNEWPEPLIGAFVETTKSGSALGRISRTGSVETYSTAQGNQIMLRDGQIIATNGLGVDLMSSNLPPTATIARADGSTYSRSYQSLDGLYQTYTTKFSCTATASGTQTITLSDVGFRVRAVTERCSGNGRSIENLYLIDSSSRIRQSRQWLGPDAGYVTLYDPNTR